MIKPIEKKLLLHSVTYNAYTENTGEGSSFGTSVTLSNVRVEELKKLFTSTDGKEIMGNAIMFYDCVNSSGLDTKPINESKITFDSHIYHIIETDILYADATTPHHYEILLK